MARTSMSLPDELLSDLGYVSRRVGITKSALVAELLGEPLHEIRVLFETIPEDPSELTASGVKRLRGASIEYVKDAVRKAKEMQDGNDFLRGDL